MNYDYQVVDKVLHKLNILFYGIYFKNQYLVEYQVTDISNKSIMIERKFTLIFEANETTFIKKITIYC
jgi:tagatose-1,6-bisphosphate aldolase non-catalytic subunit AgaZ/GatZ